MAASRFRGAGCARIRDDAPDFYARLTDAYKLMFDSCHNLCAAPCPLLRDLTDPKHDTEKRAVLGAYPVDANAKARAMYRHLHLRGKRYWVREDGRCLYILEITRARDLFWFQAIKILSIVASFSCTPACRPVSSSSSSSNTKIDISDELNNPTPSISISISRNVHHPTQF